MLRSICRLGNHVYLSCKKSFFSKKSLRLSDEHFVSNFHFSCLLNADIHTKERRRPKNFLLFWILREAIQRWNTGVRKSLKKIYVLSLIFLYLGTSIFLYLGTSIFLYLGTSIFLYLGTSIFLYLGTSIFLYLGTSIFLYLGTSIFAEGLQRLPATVLIPKWWIYL